jgi:hypothetical protein
MNKVIGVGIRLVTAHQRNIQHRAEEFEEFSLNFECHSSERDHSGKQRLCITVTICTKVANQDIEERSNPAT